MSSFSATLVVDQLRVVRIDFDDADSAVCELKRHFPGNAVLDAAFTEHRITFRHAVLRSTGEFVEQVMHYI